MSRNKVAGAVAGLLLLGGCTPDRETPDPTPSFSPGAAGIGDPYFPEAGNGGYDVAGYDLRLRYDPESGELTGRATITATATQDLSRFNFDLDGLAAQRVTVDGAAATSTAAGGELVVTPAAGVRTGTPFTVVVDYSGEPSAVRDSDLGAGGWMRTADGAFALGQPVSASTWFPVNDHPSDKATFRLAIAVPDGLEALSNGVPGERSTADGWTTWTWTEGSPMASYLATVVIGQYRVSTTTHGGRPMVIAIPESLPADGPAAQSLARTGEITDFLETQFGPYPFAANGGIVLDDDRIGYALENQARPVYGNAFFTQGPNDSVVAHEIAHQWYGDSVALDRWQDIWLNEGFATYAEWLWAEHDGQATVPEIFDRTYDRTRWTDAPGDPGAEDLFGSAVYNRGALTMHALRGELGDEAFFGLLRSWAADRRDGNVTTADFIAAAERAAGGRDLGQFFDAWLNGTTAPPR